MNIRLYQAVTQRLRSEALEATGMIESILTNPPIDGSSVADLLVEQCLKLVQYEGALITLQNYFPLNTQPAPQVNHPSANEPSEEAQSAQPPMEELISVTPEISPTYKESLKRQFGDEEVIDDDDSVEHTHGAEDSPPPTQSDWYDE